ncbi:MAG: tetratricopeptide repeat protein [Acetivibrionales bacterium]
MADKNTSKTLQYRRDPGIFFNIGLKYGNRKDYTKSLRFMEEAVKQEPFNADYRFHLACVQAELKQSEESNNSLMFIIKNIDPTLTECYFGIACNYFDLGELEKAKEYLEKYVYSVEEGEFVEAAYDILYYLQIFEDAGTGKKNSRKIARLLKQGKEFLSDEMYDKACVKFEEIIEIDPFHIPARNYLALTSFFSSNVDRAISLAGSVLKMEDDNAFAHCTLAMFYGYKNMADECNDHLDVISRLNLNTKDESIQFLKKAFSKVNMKEVIRRKIFKALNA